eukprot:1195276-Prorocentrum_minimum.AAC.5
MMRGFGTHPKLALQVTSKFEDLRDDSWHIVDATQSMEAVQEQHWSTRARTHSLFNGVKCACFARLKPASVSASEGRS